ncbi:MAG: hypothetical protein K9L78_04335 [Victivallales bacterium]|nr:hypothetical protein [Victivallales bacterium]MCF7889331.1 hypothetical protein [Victivallales bacterium]
MLSIILSFGIAGIAGILTFKYTEYNANWGILVFVATFVVLQILTSLLVRKIVKKRTEKIQKIIEDGQQKLNRKIHFYQQKPKGGMKTMQKLLEKEQHVFIKQALDKTKCLEPLYSWNILLKKQVATMRLQFYYQLRQFDKVDELLNKAMYVDPMSVAMKIVRLYKKGDPKYKKVFYKKVKKFKKNDQNVILYALYSWILVKKGEIEEAINVLQKAKEKTDNELLTRNWQALVNGKIKKFSNAGLGDQWYSLYLEEPKAQKPKQRVVRKKGAF